MDGVPEAIVAELEELRSTVGLSRESVVDKARSRRSAMHDRFTWDDKAAAHERRLDQAGNLIRLVNVKWIAADGPTMTRRYWPVREEGSTARNYEDIHDIAEDPVRTELLLRALDRDWRALKRRYEHVAGFVERITRDLAG